MDRKFRKFENNEDQNEKFSTQNQSGFPVQNQMKTKKTKGLHSNLARFLAQNWVRPKTKVFTYRLCAQTFCPSYKERAMRQFCILFYANYTVLATQRGGHGPIAPPKYAPAINNNNKNIFSRSPMAENKKILRKFSTRFLAFSTVQKIVLFSSRGQGNFRGLEGSRPRPSQGLENVSSRPRTSSRTPPLVKHFREVPEYRLQCHILAYSSAI